ncbi:hypothetical protein D3C86_1589170 [compost metagenome]
MVKTPLPQILSYLGHFRIQMRIGKLTKYRFLCMETGRISGAVALDIRQECTLVAPFEYPG